MSITQLTDLEIKNLRRLYDVVWEMDPEIAIKLISQDHYNPKALGRSRFSHMFVGIFQWPDEEYYKWRNVYTLLLSQKL